MVHEPTHLRIGKLLALDSIGFKYYRVFVAMAVELIGLKNNRPEQQIK